MVDDERKVVWVLGAGFSRSLGGPLLPELLSPTSERDILVRFESERLLTNTEACLARDLYAYGRRFDEGRVVRRGISGESMWQHAEAFADYLDAAHANPSGPNARRVMEIVRRLLQARDIKSDLNVHGLRQATRRLIAAECCAFLHEVDVASESWEPYHSWARSLRGRDTIVTFNYDRVLENLDTRYLDIVCPPNPGLALRADCARVLKLHGSVDWRRVESNGTVYFRIENGTPTFAIHAAPEELAIATPGPTKRAASRELHEIWKSAEASLSSAQAIVFIGYRFPPSDAEARERLLGAIRSNTSSHVHVHTVLGPSPSGPDSLRLLKLLEYSLRHAGRHEGPEEGGQSPRRTFRLTAHPLWAEDFLTVWDRDFLLT